MKMTRTALLGLHGSRDLVSSMQERFEAKGYITELVETPAEMLACATTNVYDRYFMDLNLGNSNSPDITSAVTIYDLVRARVEAGKAKFLGISGNIKAVVIARERNIPAEIKGLYDLAAFLE